MLLRCSEHARRPMSAERSLASNGGMTPQDAKRLREALEKELELLTREFNQASGDVKTAMLLELMELAKMIDALRAGRYP